jgi:hypothetical protein
MSDDLPKQVGYWLQDLVCAIPGVAGSVKTCEYVPSRVGHQSAGHANTISDRLFAYLLFVLYDG